MSDHRGYGLVGATLRRGKSWNGKTERRKRTSLFSFFFSFFFSSPYLVGTITRVRITFIHLSARQDKENYFQVGKLYSESFIATFHDYVSELHLCFLLGISRSHFANKQRRMKWLKRYTRA